LTTTISILGIPVVYLLLKSLVKIVDNDTIKTHF